MKNHPYYSFSPEFFAKHEFYIDEAETWCTFWDKEPPNNTKGIDYNKDTGFIRLFLLTGDSEAPHILFEGYLPDEKVLNNVFQYTGWLTAVVGNLD